MRNNSPEEQYRLMTETPAPVLVLKLGLPTTVSMLVTTIYNMADTYFVSSLGTSQSGAIGVVFGLMAIIQAFGFMFGHGAGSNIGRLLGAHNRDRAGYFASTSVLFGLITGGIITAIGFIWHTPLMNLLGSSDTILPYALEYSRYILIAAPLMVVGCIANNILRYEGRATFAMFGLVSGGLLNILGDFITIKVLDMGVAGAGLSTAVSQFIAAVILLIPFFTGKTQSRLSLRGALPGHKTAGEAGDGAESTAFNSLGSPDWAMVGNIIAVGLPSLMRQGLTSISTMILNSSARPYGDAAIAAMSIVAKVIGFMFCIGLGIGQGFQPVAGFNYGARKYSRVKSSFRFTLVFSTCLLGVIGIIGFFNAARIIAVFRDDPEVVLIGTRALRYQALSLVCLPLLVSGNMLFQSTGKSVRATVLAAMRSGLFFIPTILILRRTMGLTGIECSQSIADVLGSIFTIPFVISFIRSFPKDGEPAD